MDSPEEKALQRYMAAIEAAETPVKQAARMLERARVQQEIEHERIHAQLKADLLEVFVASVNGPSLKKLIDDAYIEAGRRWTKKRGVDGP